MVGVPADITLAVTGGASTKTWTQVSGSLPAGLTFDTSTGRIAGTPSAVEIQTITLRVDDAGPPAQSFTGPLTLTTSSALGRNDSIATATPLSNGAYLASISPADDASGATNPDNDYYAVSANPGAIVSIEITAERLTPKSSPMDSVIEILDASGTRFTTCSNFNQGGFYLSCMNDDSASVSTLDSKLFFQVPGTPGGPSVTFYVRVLDWSGMARPDFLYTITISGAN